MVIGNLTAGRRPGLMPMLFATLGAMALVLALFTLTAHEKIAAAMTIFLIGALGFATVRLFKKRVLDQASGAPTLASAVSIGAVQPRQRTRRLAQRRPRHRRRPRLHLTQLGQRHTHRLRPSSWH